MDHCVLFILFCQLYFALVVYFFLYLQVLIHVYESTSARSQLDVAPWNVHDVTMLVVMCIHFFSIFFFFVFFFFFEIWACDEFVLP